MVEIIETSLFHLLGNERDVIVATIVDETNVEWALNLLCRYIPENDKPLTAEEKTGLKKLILENSSAEVATLALVNTPISFSEEELDTLRKIAYTTTNEYSAHALYVNECFDLQNKKETRDTLREIIVGTNDPYFAFKMLETKDDNIALYEDDLKSLYFSAYEIDKFKRVILDGESPECAYRLLRTKETAEMIKEERQSSDYYSPYQTHSVVELTESERTKLKRIVIEGQDSEWAFMTFNYVKGVTEGEKLVLKGIIMRINDPDLACMHLCNTDFISYLDKAEREYFRKLAVQTKNWWSAEEALKYIFDLTSEERSILEKIAKDK